MAAIELLKGIEGPLWSGHPFYESSGEVQPDDWNIKINL